MIRAARSAIIGAVVCVALATARAEPRHVVLVVWDGMRPDFVTAEFAPALNQLARDGVRFQNHHSVYVTATNVNGTAIATGVYPNKSGLFANSEWRPAIEARRAIDTAEPASITAGGAAAQSQYLGVPTLAEIVRNAGKRVAIAGSKSVVMLHDRANEWTVATVPGKTLTVFAGAPMPEPLRDQLTRIVGPFRVNPGDTGAARNAFTTRALTEVLWRDGLPDVSLLWLGEPDLAEHNHAPGSPEAIAAIKSADDNLATVLKALDEKHARATTDVMVVSDHGFSTIRRSIDVTAELVKAGFNAAREFSETPKRGDILTVGNGGTVLFYIHEHDRPTCERLVEWLQRTDFVGALFTRDGMAGTFPLSAVRIDTANAADVVMSFRWTSEKNQFGVPGMIDADWNRKAGQGTHATLSPFDTHATFVAAGPDFRERFESSAPTGNIDIAPTILRILGVQHSEARFDGRVVSEAMTGASPDSTPPVIEPETLTAKKPGEDAWQQWMKTSRVGRTIYFDAALGSAARK